MNQARPIRRLLQRATHRLGLPWPQHVSYSPGGSAWIVRVESPTTLILSRYPPGQVLRRRGKGESSLTSASGF